MRLLRRKRREKPPKMVKGQIARQHHKPHVGTWERIGRPDKRTGVSVWRRTG